MLHQVRKTFIKLLIKETATGKDGVSHAFAYKHIRLHQGRSEPQRSAGSIVQFFLKLNVCILCIVDLFLYLGTLVC
jgi:hypothetical protein